MILLKLAVIGGGPGGLTAALEALKQGHDVVLFEKGMIGEDIRCGECLYNSFGLIGKTPLDVSTKIERIIFKIEQEHEWQLENFNKLWMLDRKKWQLGMAKEAIAQGLKICEGTPIDSRYLQTLSSDFDYVIDASGAPSVTSVKYGFSQEYLIGCGVAIQHVMQGDFSQYHGALKLGFFPGIHGYYWIFPKSDTSANVGVGLYIEEVRGGQNLKTLLNEVLLMENLQDLAVEKTISGILPAKIVDKVVHDNILLVGEAAGLTSPLHGEGIDLACISAQLAVRSICDGDLGVLHYESKLRELIDLKWKKEMMIADFWKTLSFNQFDNFVHSICTNNKLLLARAALQHPSIMKYAWKWMKHKA